MEFTECNKGKKQKIVIKVTVLKSKELTWSRWMAWSVEVRETVLLLQKVTIDWQITQTTKVPQTHVNI
jgi:hypothetical protein